MEKTIFYSWQSDSDSSTNKILIRDAVKQAIKSYKKEKCDLDLRVDSDTQGLTGTPDIIAEIFKKIDSCSVFVADISIINPNDKNTRKTCNPNVLLELGYAAKRLGWNRVICVFNSHFGKVEDLPFDLRGRKPFIYDIGPGLSESDLEKKKQFVYETMVHHVRAILNSKEPIEEQVVEERKTTDEIKRERDIRTLNEILGDVSTSAIEGHIHLFRQKEVVPNSIFHHFYNFMNYTESASFYVYDVELKEKILDLWNKLAATLNHGEDFIADDNCDYYRLFRGSWQYADKYEAVAKIIHSEINELDSSLREFVNFVSENYIEVDLKEKNKEARQRQIDEENEIKERITGKPTDVLE